MQIQTTYAAENTRNADILYFMQNSRVADTPESLRMSVIRSYRDSTLEAARIPADWYQFDISQEG